MARGSPVLSQLNLVVRDMDAAVAFYRRLGLTIRETAPEWREHHRSAVMPDSLDLDLDSAEFATRWNRGWPAHGPPGMGVIGFSVSSRQAVDELYAELTGAGHAGQQPPYDAFWGARYAVVADPDGRAVGLMSPVDPDRVTPARPPGSD